MNNLTIIPKETLASMVSCMHEKIMRKDIYADVFAGNHPYVVIDQGAEIEYPYCYDDLLFCKVENELRCYLPENNVSDWVRDFMRMKEAAKKTLLLAIAEFLGTEVNLQKEVPGMERITFENWSKNSYGKIFSSLGMTFAGEFAPFRKVVSVSDPLLCFKAIERERYLDSARIGEQDGTLSYIISGVCPEKMVLQGVFAPSSLTGEYHGQVIHFAMTYRPLKDIMEVRRTSPETPFDVGAALAPDYVFNVLRNASCAWVQRGGMQDADPIMQILLSANVYSESIMRDIEKVSGKLFVTYSVDIPKNSCVEKHFVVEAKQSVLRKYHIM